LTHSNFERLRLLAGILHHPLPQGGFASTALFIGVARTVPAVRRSNAATVRGFGRKNCAFKRQNAFFSPIWSLSGSLRRDGNSLEPLWSIGYSMVNTSQTRK
jgi:hypothetical protein